MLLADGDVFDLGVRVDGQTKALGELGHPLLRRREVEEDAASSWLDGEDDVLGDGHHGDEHEMLMHHPHPVVDRGAR